MKLFVFLLIIVSGLNFVATENDFKDGVNSTSSCCENLYFSSTGPLADSGQNHILGYYAKLSNGPEGYWNYQQTSEIKRKLWYNPSIKAWFIGDHLGLYYNIGFLRNLKIIMKIV